MEKDMSGTTSSLYQYSGNQAARRVKTQLWKWINKWKCIPTSSTFNMWLLTTQADCLILRETLQFNNDLMGLSQMHITASHWNPANPHLHAHFSLVKAHQHVDNIKARCWLVLLMNPTDQCTESLFERGKNSNWDTKHLPTLCSRSLKLHF